MHALDKRLKADWRRYLFQCLLAFLALIAILYFLDLFTEAAIVAALGASAFIVFAMPNSVTAQPRNVIGGHIMGLIAGSICYFALVVPCFWVEPGKKPKKGEEKVRVEIEPRELKVTATSKSPKEVFDEKYDEEIESPKEDVPRPDKKFSIT